MGFINTILPRKKCFILFIKPKVLNFSVSIQHQMQTKALVKVPPNINKLNVTSQTNTTGVMTTHFYTETEENQYPLLILLLGYLCDD